MISGVILASGRSTRMGRAKALLPATGGTTFVAHLAQTLAGAGVAEVLIVGRPDHEALRREVAALTVPARFVDNPGADAGQLTSVIAALAIADRPGVEGLLVTPVDLPLVRPESVRALLQRFSSAAAPIVRLVHQGRHGHPVIFARALFAELRAADVSKGAKVVVRAHAAAIVDVEVDDPGVVEDVDTPEDYARAFGRPL